MQPVRSSRSALIAVAMSCLLSTDALSAQPLKRDVDVLVASTRKLDARNAQEAAVYLVALVHCHRGYDMSDGPVIRAPRAVIYRARGGDGLWGKGDNAALTSAWVYQALHDLDKQAHAVDLEEIRKAYGKRFGLRGTKLAAKLAPFGPWRKLELPEGLRPEFRKLIETVAQQKTKVLETQGKSKKAERKFEAFEQSAIDFLMKSCKDGVWYVPTPDGKTVPDPGITALCLAAVGSKPPKLRSKTEKLALEKGIAWLIAAQSRTNDGSFSSYVPNYVTCAAILALSDIDGLDVDRKLIKESLAKAQKYLLTIQNVEGLKYAQSDRDYGSIGYGGDQRGDLSNTQMAIEGLRKTGLDVKDEAFAKALIYLRRLQNLPGKGSFESSRKTKDGRKVKVVAGGDGGAQYYPGNSPAGYDTTADGKQIPRSYGSMTYALLKCYVLCGLEKNDPRLQAALNWCFSNYTLEVNPGSKPELGEKAKYQGLFYYYLTLARAFNLAGVDEVKDGKGKAHDWRQELREQAQEHAEKGRVLGQREELTLVGEQSDSLHGVRLARPRGVAQPRQRTKEPNDAAQTGAARILQTGSQLGSTPGPSSQKTTTQTKRTARPPSSLR